MSFLNATNLSISVSDPLLFYIRVLNFRNKLNKIFDNLIIGVAGCDGTKNIEHTKTLKNFFDKLASDTTGLKINYFKGHAGNHGKNIRTLLKNNWDDVHNVVLIMEDDDFIINEEMLINYVGRLQKGEIDFVGESRGCSNNQHFMEFETSVIKEDNLVENLYGQFHPHFWPTHFLIHKMFLRPDDTFENHLFKKDTEINFRNRIYKFEFDTTGDTFVKFSVDLWNRINKAREHKTYELGTPEYIDKFAYCFRSGLLYDWLRFEESPEKYALKMFQFHIGSASCLLGFWNKDIDILNEEMFKQVNQFVKVNDYNGVIEIYRRYYLYKIIFNVVKDDLEFLPFKEGYEQNFSVADRFFNEIGIPEMLATKDYKMMPSFIFDSVFKYIIGR